VEPQLRDGAAGDTRQENMGFASNVVLPGGGMGHLPFKANRPDSPRAGRHRGVADTYEIGGGKQKTVFSAGTVYFRHGAKSEPGTSDDLWQFLEREIEATRRSWLDGIAKVVDAPTGARIAVIAPEAQAANPSGAVSLRLTNDPNAPRTTQFRSIRRTRIARRRSSGRSTRLLQVERSLIRAISCGYVDSRHPERHQPLLHAELCDAAI